MSGAGGEATGTPATALHATAAGDATAASHARDAAVALASLTGLVFLAHVIDAHWRPAAARVVVAGVVFSVLGLRRDLLRSRWPWVLLTGALAWVLLEIPYRLGNHHYVLCYLGLAMFLCNGRDDRTFLADLAFLMRWFVVAIMTIAIVQRLLSPTFMDGSYLGLMLARGSFFRIVYAFCESCREIAGINLDRAADLGARDPNTGASVVLRSPLPDLALAARAFAIVILAVEAWIALAFAFFRSALVRHSILLPFVVALGFTRSEFVFAALLALAGLATCGLSHRRLRLAYTVLVLVLAACVFLFPVETGAGALG